MSFYAPPPYFTRTSYEYSYLWQQQCMSHKQWIPMRNGGHKNGQGNTTERTQFSDPCYLPPSASLDPFTKIKMQFQCFPIMECSQRKNQNNNTLHNQINSSPAAWSSSWCGGHGRLIKKQLPLVTKVNWWETNEFNRRRFLFSRPPYIYPRTSKYDYWDV